MEKSQHTKEFKQEAVALAKQEENTFQQVADNLGSRVKTLCHWSNHPKKQGDKAFPGKLTVKQT